MSNAPALATRGLTRRFGPVRAVDGVDLTVPVGEVLALLGPNGAGKTTLLDMALGFSPPSDGTVRVLGSDPVAAVRQGRVGAVLQTGGLLEDLSVRETVAMVAGCHRRHIGVPAALERAGLTGLAGRRVKKCSGGERQRLRFALALLTDPELLILDEPTAGMDVRARHDFWDTMHAEADRGRTIVFATHFLPEAEDFADMQTVEKAIPRVEKEVKGKKKEPADLEALKAALAVLERGETIFAAKDKDKLDMDRLRELSLLTAKPFIYVFNSDEGVLGDEAKQQELRDLVAPADAVFLDAKLESDLVELSEEEAAEMLEMAGQDESGLDQLARVGFSTLGLQTYLTAGPKETRAWTIPVGATAPEAAGVIHTDFQRGFIKAEIVSFDDLMAAGSMADAKAAGKVRMEGKDYVMRDGDVVEFRFNI